MVFFENLKKNYYLFIIIIFLYLPLNYTPQLFDGVLIDYAFETGNIDLIEFWYKDAIRYFHFYIIYFVNILSSLTQISHEYFLDFFSILFLFLYCLETKIYSNLIFNLRDKYCNLAALFVSIFPVWHTFVSFNVSQYLFSFYCLFFGYRNFISNKSIKVFIGLFFIILSFEVESSLSFIIGLSFVHILLNKKNKINNFSFSRFFFLFFLCFIYYIIKNKYYPTAGYWAGYNQLSLGLLSNLSIQKILPNILNYLTYLLFFIWIPIMYYFKTLTQNKFSIKKINIFNLFYNEYSLLILLSAFAIFPYILVNKSASILYLSDYYQRHAFLLAPIFGIFFAKMFSDMENNNPFKKKIYFNFCLLLFIFINLTLLNYGTMRKIEAHHFKKNLITEFKNYGTLPSGDIQIISKNYPVDLRDFEISHTLFKAYNDTSWWGFLASLPNERKPEIRIVENKEYSKLNIMENYSFECKNYIYLKNDLNKLERIRRVYVFDYKKYFIIDKITSKCK